MLDRDFAHTRDYLLSKLPDYLRQRGINPESKFSCVNPAHREHPLTMSYDASERKVRCFSCGAAYDLFALIGLDRGIRDFAGQFRAAHELFIGPVPYELELQLQNQGAAPDADSVRQPRPEIRPSEGSDPMFEIDSGDYRIRREEPRQNPGADQRPQYFQPLSPFTQPPRQQGAGTVHLPGGGLSISASPQAAAPRSFGSYQSPQPVNGAYRAQTFFRQPGDELQNDYDYAEYLKSCARNAANTDYFKARGLSDEVIARFRLGYDDHYIAGTDQLGAQVLWRAAIVPYSDKAYMARNTARDDKDRFRKQGRFELFNRKALDSDGPVFVTEGEFDALSLETLGCAAVALGGTGNVRAFAEIVRGLDPSINHTYYLCLDSDHPGREAADELRQRLYDLRVPCIPVDIAFPYKDANEMLVKERDELISRLKNLDSLLMYHLAPLPSEPVSHSLIASSEDLSNLRVSDALYALCARPQTARMLIADIISACQVSLVYAGTLSQWEYLSSLVQRPRSEATSAQNTFWKSVRLLEIGSDHVADDIISGITACRIQGEKPFITVADLSAMPAERCAATATELGRMCGTYGVPVVALCNPAAAPYVEALAVQSISVRLTPNGDYACETLDAQGQPYTFTRYKTAAYEA